MKVKNVVLLLGILLGVLCLFAGGTEISLLGFLVAVSAILAALTLFKMFVEAFPLSIGLRIPYRSTFRVLVTANIASLLVVWIPVQALNSFLYSTYMPVPLAPYFRAYPVAAALGSLITFVVILLVEYGVVAGWCRKQQIQTGWARLLLIVLIMNAATHAVLAPARYQMTRPRHDVKTFTDDSSWAQHPLTEIYYLAANGNLCAVMTDGSNNRVVIPDTVRDYQFLPRQGLYLYRNADDALCLFRESDKQIVECGLPLYKYSMNHVTCSPNGQTVAFWQEELSVGYGENCRLMLFNTDTAKQYSTEVTATNQWNDNFPALAWGDSPDILFMKDTKKKPATITSIIISNNTATLHQTEEQPCELAEAYGRFSKYRRYGDDWRGIFYRASNEHVKIRAWTELGSGITIEQGKDRWRIADNPGLLNLSGNRRFRDVSLLENGQEFVFNDNKGGIYLVNIAERKVGQITSGGTFITLTPRYRQNLWEEDDSQK